MKGARAAAAAARRIGADADVHVVWMAMLKSDDRRAAEAATAKHLSGVGNAWWDADRVLGKGWGPVLGLPESKPAWDVYLVLSPEARWEVGPPAPVEWWHQLHGAPAAHRAGPALIGDLLAAVRALVPERPTR